MIPDRYFQPLKYAELIDFAAAKSDDDGPSRAVIREVLFDPRARNDPGVFQLVWEYGEFIEDDESDFAAGLLAELIEAHPAQRFALGALRAAWLDPGAAEIEKLYHELLSLPLAERDLRFYYLAPSVFADEGDEDRGSELAREGVALAKSRGQAEEANAIISRSPAPEHRAEAARLLEEFFLSVRDRLDAEQGTAPADDVHFRMVYLPEQDYATALADGLIDATYPLRHEDYRRELEQSLSRAAGNADVSVVPVSLAEILAYAGRTGADPALRSTKVATVDGIELSRDTPWPPERNASCWCGSGRKYKKCCGHPGFRNLAIPDRGRTVLRVELTGTDPLVWRTIAVPHRIRLDELHEVICAAMGWTGIDHRYAFQNSAGVQVHDPGCECGAPKAHQQRLDEAAAAPGQGVTYLYDFGDEWEHAVTVQEIVAVDPDANKPDILDGAGACPPEDSGGVHRYQDLLAALLDTDDPMHEEAAEWLGPDWDPAAWHHPHPPWT